MTTPAFPPDEPDAFSVAEFAARHRISVPSLYKEWQAGRGPIFFRVGVRRLISRESAARWRAEREQEAKKATA